MNTMLTITCSPVGLLAQQVGSEPTGRSADYAETAEMPSNMGPETDQAVVLWAFMSLLFVVSLSPLSLPVATSHAVRGTSPLATL